MVSDNISTDKQSQDPEQFPRTISLAIRIIFPISLLMLSINYVSQTWGQIRMSNLHYPYFVISAMCLLSVVVLIEEVINTQNIKRNLDVKNSLIDFVNKWSVSIKFIFICSAYILLIPIIGFFTSSLAVMILSIYTAGGRSYQLIGLTVSSVLLLVWLTTVMILGINLPGGIIDDLFI